MESCRRQQHARPRVLLPAIGVAVLLLLTVGPPSATAYGFNPFQGQGVVPPGSVKVYLTVLVERVLHVDQRDYNFEAIVYVYFSWVDPRAKAAITEFSALQNSPEYNNGNGCMRYCDNAYEQPWGGLSGPNMTSSRLCCDGIWLPTFAFRNGLELPEGRVEPLYAIVVAKDNKTVTWRQTVHGKFFTPMDFKTFPFDKQDLIVEISTTQAIADKIVVVPSATSHKLFVHGAGDDLSTWKVKRVTITVDPPLLGSDLIRHSTPVHPDDPSPQSAVNATDAQLANSVVPPLFFCVTKVHIEVHRLWTYFLWTCVLPVVFLVWVAHVTFFIGPTHLSDRVSVLITLMLALVALQWVIAADLPDSSYLLPTSQLILLAYVSLGLLVMISVAVYRISKFKAMVSAKMQRQAAAAHLARMRAQLTAGTFVAAKCRLDLEANGSVPSNSAVAAAGAASCSADIALTARKAAPAQRLNSIDIDSMNDLVLQVDDNSQQRQPWRQPNVKNPSAPPAPEAASGAAAAADLGPFAQQQAAGLLHRKPATTCGSSAGAGEVLLPAPSSGEDAGGSTKAMHGWPHGGSLRCSSSSRAANHQLSGLLTDWFGGRRAADTAAAAADHECDLACSSSTSSSADGSHSHVSDTWLPGPTARLPLHGSGALGNLQQPVVQLLTRQLSKQEAHPRTCAGRLRRTLLFYRTVLHDEDVAACVAHNVDKVCYTFVFLLFNIGGLLMMAVPHLQQQ